MHPATHDSDNALYRFEPCEATGENQFIPKKGATYTVTFKVYDGDLLLYEGTGKGFKCNMDPVVGGKYVTGDDPVNPPEDDPVNPPEDDPVNPPEDDPVDPPVGPGEDLEKPGEGSNTGDEKPGEGSNTGDEKPGEGNNAGNENTGNEGEDKDTSSEGMPIWLIVIIAVAVAAAAFAVVFFLGKKKK